MPAGVSPCRARATSRCLTCHHDGFGRGNLPLSGGGSHHLLRLCWRKGGLAGPPFSALWRHLTSRGYPAARSLLVPSERRIPSPAQVADEVVDPLPGHGDPQPVVGVACGHASGERLYELELDRPANADLYVLVALPPDLDCVAAVIGSEHVLSGHHALLCPSRTRITRDTVQRDRRGA